MALIGQCYCGATQLHADEAPQTAAYCHCVDCRRWTGAPLPAFAAFAADTFQLTPAITPVTHPSGAIRCNCPKCGSPLSATFPYLPGQIYVPPGLLDDAATVIPNVHCHAGSALPWLHLTDDLPREGGSGRDRLQEART